EPATVSVATELFELDPEGRRSAAAVATLAPVELQVPAGSSASGELSTRLANPKLWGTGANQRPNRYAALTTVRRAGEIVDVHESRFGVRTLVFYPDAGFLLNGEPIPLNGVCNHHDLGALGAALNYRALERQLQLLAEMGANAIRTSHNP